MLITTNKDTWCEVLSNNNRLVKRVHSLKLLGITIGINGVHKMLILFMQRRLVAYIFEVSVVSCLPMICCIFT